MSKYMEGDDKNVFKLLKREGRKDKALCVQVLQYFGKLCTEENMKNNKKIDNNEVDEDSDQGSDGDDIASEEEKYVIKKNKKFPPFLFSLKDLLTFLFFEFMFSFDSIQ